MKVCDITGVGRTFGKNVPHSKKRTSRSWLPNLHTVRIKDDNGQTIKLKVSAAGLRTMKKKGIL